MKKTEIKLVALDLDGTLYSKYGTLSSYGEMVLRKLKENGIKIVLSSGRPLYSIQRSISKDLYDYASCMNGQEIYIQKTKDHIIQNNLSKEEMDDLISYLKKYPLILYYSSGTNFYSYMHSSHSIYKYLYSIMYAIVHIVRNDHSRRNQIETDPTKCHFEQCGKFCFAGPNGLLKKFYKELDSSKYSAFFVNSHWLEVQPAGISKGHALKQILDLEHLSKQEALAIGDGENDISMFEVVGTAIAMKNAMKSVKKKADFIADSYQKDGCAKWLDKNLLKKKA